MTVKINDLIKKLQEIKDIKGNVPIDIVDIGEYKSDRIVLFEGLRGNLVAIGETKVGRAKNFPTAKQTYSINLILKHNPSLEFTGKTKEEASTFINTYKHTVPTKTKITFDEYKVSFPTPKQIGYINVLEENNGVAFEGTTFKEATEYITKYGYNNNKQTKSTNSSSQKDYEMSFTCIDDDDIPF